jgi:hypothetical protein
VESLELSHDPRQINSHTTAYCYAGLTDF